MGVGEKVGREGYVRRKWVLFAFLWCQSHKVEAKQLVGVCKIVGRQQDSSLVPRPERRLSEMGDTAQEVMATHNSANIFLAVSASNTGFFSGFGPGAITPSPIMFKVLLSVHPSGRSSCMSTNWVRRF